jgi:ribosomal protein S20
MAIKLSPRNGAIGGLTALLLGGGLLFGTALAKPGQPAQPGPGQGRPAAAARDERFQSFVGKLAANLHSDESMVRAALVTTEQQMVDDGVKAGRFTTEQAARLKQRIQQSGGAAIVHAGPGAGAGLRAAGALRATIQSAAEEALGLSPTDLRTRLRAGTTLTRIAQDLGKDPSVVKQKLITALQARIDDAAKGGQLAPERAVQVKANLATHVDALMNRVFGQGPQQQTGRVRPRRR